MAPEDQIRDKTVRTHGGGTYGCGNSSLLVTYGNPVEASGKV